MPPQNCISNFPCTDAHHIDYMRQSQGSDKHSERESPRKQQQEQRRDPITVRLTTCKKNYQSGGHIQGTVSLFVPPCVTDCSEFSGLHLLLEGKETVKRFVPETARHEEFNKEIVNEEAEVISLTSPLVPGQYDYQVEMKLPESLPWSIHCESEDDDRCSCDVQYKLTAYMRRCNNSGTKTYSVVNCSQVICIAPPRLCSTPLDFKGSSPPSPSTNHTETKPFTVRSWLLKKGAIDLGFETEESVLSPYSSNTIRITGRNRSSVPVKYLLVRLIERVQWGNPHASERIVAQTKVYVDNVRSWDKQESEERRKRRQTPMETVAVKLHMKSARNSYRGKLIQVSHSLQISAVMKGEHSTTPKLMVATQVGQTDEEIPVIVNAQVVALEQVLPQQEVSNNVQSKLPEAVPVLMDDSVLEIPKVQQGYHYTSASCLEVDNSVYFHSFAKAEMVEPAKSN